LLNAWIPIGYLIAASLFIFGLQNLSTVRSARRGNALAALGMLLAITLTLIDVGAVDYRYILAGLVIGSAIGAVAAARVPMTAMPEMVALFNGFGGGASALVTLSIVFRELSRLPSDASVKGAVFLGGAHVAVSGMLGLIIGALTFTGSVVAFLKLRGSITEQPVLIPMRHLSNILVLGVALALGAALTSGTFSISMAATICFAILAISLLLGTAAVLPIGGADMPVVISLLNSFSGVAAAMAGFALSNYLLIISGSLVGASGLILTRIMCKAMNRSLANVLFSGFGGEAPGRDSRDYKNIKEATAEEVALLLEDATSVVFAPGYGLAVARAQHVTRELGDFLLSRGVDVHYAIHPVAGRMPGHMNVLLAEAEVPYDQLVEMSEINPEFKATDVSILLGANDVVNPAALSDKKSPIYGMPILNVHESRTVVVVKRSLSPGFAGIRNELFDHDNTVMCFGDAKKVMTDVLNELKS
jgi:NAD(P) transhydrogenase subunit beta